jgi:hypothetical protein
MPAVFLPIFIPYDSNTNKYSECKMLVDTCDKNHICIVKYDCAPPSHTAQYIIVGVLFIICLVIVIHLIKYS